MVKAVTDKIHQQLKQCEEIKQNKKPNHSNKLCQPSRLFLPWWTFQQCNQLKGNWKEDRTGQTVELCAIHWSRCSYPKLIQDLNTVKHFLCQEREQLKMNDYSFRVSYRFLLTWKKQAKQRYKSPLGGNESDENSLTVVQIDINYFQVKQFAWKDVINSNRESINLTATHKEALCASL